MVYCDACKETSCSSETQIEGDFEEDIVIIRTISRMCISSRASWIVLKYSFSVTVLVYIYQ